ncbi:MULTISPECIES: hypothetical protein [Pseudomonas]|uniref:hypothetical protein n=1 Tax=Pseudomonas TaxID=286 RepID=UPI000A1FC8E6|nr:MULTISPECIES: hypothetical protein [Pseudomonas]PNB77963.1 hypothetical protein C1X30_25610 [Pseudomonas sp. FW305-BF6]MCH4898882.1 hypothetical protein [Pseudomonas sp. B707]PNA00164.1 hypothetical protein C1X28_26700 [Pseudomonas sp. FW305-BF15]PNB48770.1 hypothetical protein C1X29_17395 [Pseudomonas sp. GW456-12-10-14-LB2]TEA63063.1 hypothetical protein EIY71_05070 [Pseudomonas sp. CH235]
MRTIVITVATLSLALLAVEAQARELSKSHRFACTWGSDIAAGAQQSKLSGISLYGARKRLQARKFQQPWMRMTAMGITEQTYDSASRLKPAAVKQTYYEQCVRHELAQR